MPDPPDGPPLLAALARLRDDLAAASLGLDLGGAAEARRERVGLIGQIDDYLLPRLRRLDAPLLAVVGGSTGAGKSTLVNSLVGAPVSTAGVLRPTTRAPVLVCAPQDRPAFAGDRVLPGLPRTTGAGADPGSLQLVATPQLSPGLALLDAPDIDSVVTANRELAASLLAAADLWLFVTTAARYADAVPWQLLRTARERSTALAVVLNRVPPEARTEVSAHLAEMLRAEGLGDAALFTLPETRLTAGALPAADLAEVSGWLRGLAADAGRRAEVVRGTLNGALDSLRGRVAGLAEQADRQAAAGRGLLGHVAAAYDGAATDVDRALRDGALLRGEVLARWQEFVGTGELLRTLEARIGRLRDRLKAALTGRPTPEAELRGAVESGLESLVLDAADRAAERSVEAWRVEPGGRGLLGPDPTHTLGRSSPDLPERLGAQVRAWQGYVLELVAEQGADKRTAARLASLGVNGAGLAAMLTVFAHTGGLTGAEVAIAGGTSAAGHRLLEAVFGDQAVRTLAAQARAELVRRVRALLDAEVARFAERLSTPPDTPSGDALRGALAAVERARRTLGAVRA